MENPEEVLQALDEFQKMRPSEIPRELEEYLCWVAKTGDPVYQWSLIKPLFREKLTRVMTDFYESCPTLELAPCPNVEQFNYDIMKCNLLELLESFANAPFTVQRICELLTAPRKEYNRVDKFMRAIEKNILVVSTREPGPAARRSENGDGMVNGSVDEDVPSSQPSHEVEMESWVKDCTADAAVTVSAEENNAPLLDSVITAGKVAKIVATNEESLPIIQEKTELPISRSEVTNSNVTADSREIVANLTPVDNQDPICESNIENLSSNGAENSAIVAEVPEAVMNEDTSSQPSLDSEADEGESTSPRKLQTTFQTKDFGKTDVKSPKFYADDVKEASEKSRVKDEEEIEGESVASSVRSEDSAEKSISEPKLSFECQESVLPIVESLLEKRPRVESETTDLETGESPAEEEGTSPSKKSCIVITEVTQRSEASAAFLAISIEMKTSEGTSKMDENTVEASTETTCTKRLLSCEIAKTEIYEEQSKENVTDSTDDSLPEAERAAEISESSRPIVEEPSFEESSEDSTSKSPPQRSTAEQRESSGVTIEEAMDDDTRINKSIVPDPIPIIEEPKDTEPSSRDPESCTIIEELPIEESTESIEVAAPIEIAVAPMTTTTTTVLDESPSAGSMSEEVANVRTISQEDITDVRSSPTEAEEKVEPAESMEVDGEESLPAFQQDEPMEQEPGDLVKS